MENVEEQQLCEPTVEIHNILYDVFGSDSSANDHHVDTKGQTTNVRAEYAEKFYNLLNDANTHLYPGSTKMKKLEFVVKLYQAKCLSGSTDKGMDIMLKLVKSILPDGETLLDNFYNVKQLIKDLGLTYQKIDACPNDCMLYWKESILDDSCKHWGQSRYQKQDVGENDDSRKVPAKVLRYFPLTPRLQRLYLSRYTTNHMSWHAKERTNDGILRHPTDSPASKHLDKEYPLFADEQCNVRLGLANSGFIWPHELIALGLS
ncbi:hypothetical protein CerSpe_068120 [Prunus speciosa]